MIVHVGLVNVIAGLFIVSLSSIGLGCCIAGLWMLRELKKPRRPKKEYKTSDYRRDEPELDMISHKEARRRIRKGEQYGETR
jgi:hypothetical protein